MKPTQKPIRIVVLNGLQKRAILNIKACLEAAGSDLDKVVRRRIYIIDMKEFRKVDAVWGEYFEKPYPVSTCVQVRDFNFPRLITHSTSPRLGRHSLHVCTDRSL